MPFDFSMFDDAPVGTSGEDTGLDFSMLNEKKEPPKKAEPSFWQKAVEAAKSIPDVAKLLFEEPTATVKGGLEGAAEGAVNAADTVIPMGLRVGGAIGGGIAGGAVSAPTVAGIPLGVVGGGAAGAGLGETLAEEYETLRGHRKGLNPTQIATQTALGAVPVFGQAGTVGKAVLSRGGQGAVMGGVSSAATDLAEGKMPTVGGVAQGTALGALLGAGGGALEARAAAAKAPAPEVELPAAAAVAEKTPELDFSMLDDKFIDTFGPHAYAGPERRSVSGEGPGGVERRTLKDQPLDLSNPVQAATQMMNENPRITKEAAELQARARASRAPAPPREGSVARETSADIPAGGANENVQPVSRATEAKPEILPEVPRETDASVSTEIPNATAKPEQPSARSIRDMAEARGKPIPEQKPLTKERIEGEGTLIAHMPEPVRKGVAEVLDSNNHFEAQRRGVQTNERTEALADYVNVESRKALPKGTALNAEETHAYANAVATTQDKIDGLAAKVKDGSASDFDLAALARAQQEQVVQMASFLGARAETGRALQAHKMLGQILEGNDIIAIRAALKNPKLRENLQNFAEKWSTLGSDAEKLEFLRSQQAQSWMDVVKGVYYSNILSGVKTHLRNIIGNTANAAFSNAAHIAATGYDIGRSVLTGKERTIFASELPHRAFGTVMGIKQGIDDALMTLQHGYSPQALATFDVPRAELRGGGKNPLNWTGRALEAEDQFFHGVAYNQELYSRLYAKARGEASKRGLKGDDMGKFVEDRLASWKMNVPPDVADAAHQAAQRMVYKEDAGEWSKAITHAKSKIPVLDFVIPFVKTPANIIRQGIEATPLAPLTKQTRTALRAGGREGAEAVGRMTVGTVGLAALAFWASQGVISGDGPSDPEQRAALMESGWRPNSIKIAGKWYDYSNALQPLSQPLFAIANAYEQYRTTGKKPNPAEIASATGGAILSQSFLSGLSDLNMALSDPGRYGERFAARIAQGFVPASGLSRNVAQAIDPVVRDPKGSLTDNLKTIVPGMSQDVAPKLDRFGEEVKRPGGPFTRGLSPIGISPESKDPMIVELTKIGMNDIGLPPKRLSALPSKHIPAMDLTIEERQTYGRARRAAIEAVLRQPQYQQLDEEQKRAAIKKAVDTAAERAVFGIRARRRSR